MNKHCPLCNSQAWNYDIIVSLSGLCFCGDCWYEVKQEALKIGYNILLGMPKSIYNKALKIAKSKLLEA